MPAHAIVGGFTDEHTVGNGGKESQRCSEVVPAKRTSKKGTTVQAEENEEAGNDRRNNRNLDDGGTAISWRVRHGNHKRWSTKTAIKST